MTTVMKTKWRKFAFTPATRAGYTMWISDGSYPVYLAIAGAAKPQTEDGYTQPEYALKEAKPETIELRARESAMLRRWQESSSDLTLYEFYLKEHKKGDMRLFV